jgi:hypothetical protein
LPSVVESFRERHGAWAATLGFDAVWIVGQGEGFTHRLDTPNGVVAGRLRPGGAAPETA